MLLYPPELPGKAALSLLFVIKEVVLLGCVQVVAAAMLLGASHKRGLGVALRGGRMHHVRVLRQRGRAGRSHHALHLHLTYDGARSRIFFLYCFHHFLFPLVHYYIVIVIFIRRYCFPIDDCYL